MAERTGGRESVRFPLPLTSMTLSKFLKVLETNSSVVIWEKHYLPRGVMGGLEMIFGIY